ncbi:MAG: hypothetical protein NTZ74_01700 [Chloroflexi bacterium]|nr:hypothetical protein [Chloroflexota bacterium]
MIALSMSMRGVLDYLALVRVLPGPTGGSLEGFPPHAVRLGESLGDWSSSEPAVGVYLEVPVRWMLLDVFGIEEKRVRVFAAAGVAP